MEKIIFKKNDISFDIIKKKLENGGIIIYPTDTVYGVGANFTSLDGLKKIYNAKERDFNSPLIALLSNIKYINKIAIIDEYKSDMIKKLTTKFWPGPLTIILPKKPIVPDIMVSSGNTVGIRIPNLKIARDIIEKAGGILATTSANISGENSPKNYGEINELFKKRVDLIIIDEDDLLGIESTILDLSSEKPRIIREGAIKKEEIEKIIGKNIEFWRKNESTKNKPE